MIKRYPKGVVATVSLAAILVAGAAIYAQASKLQRKHHKAVQGAQGQAGPEAMGCGGGCASEQESCAAHQMMQMDCRGDTCKDADCEARGCDYLGEIGRCAECRKDGKVGLCTECLTKGLKLSDAERRQLDDAVEKRNKAVAAADKALEAAIKSTFDDETARTLTARLKPHSPASSAPAHPAGAARPEGLLPPCSGGPAADAGADEQSPPQHPSPSPDSPAKDG